MAIGNSASKIASRVACIAACIIIAGSLSARASEILDGFWMDSDGEVVMEIAPCGQARCGRVAWLKQPNGPDGLPLRDFRNSTAALRSRLVCGLEVISGFTRQSDGSWGGGNVYVPDLGASFSGTTEVLSATQVKVTGYIGLPIFGASEIWTKIATPPARCATPDQGAAAGGAGKKQAAQSQKALSVTSR